MTDMALGYKMYKEQLCLEKENKYLHRTIDKINAKQTTQARTSPNDWKAFKKFLKFFNREIKVTIRYYYRSIKS